MMHIRKTLLATTVLCACFSAAALADEAVDYKKDTLTGDWGGARTALANKGFSAELGYTYDVMSNISGGVKESTRGLGNVDAIVTIDGEKAFGSKGTTALVHVLGNHGGRPSDEIVGDAQGVDNIEVPVQTAKVFEAWVQQNAFDDKLSVLGGIYAVDSEFDVTDTSGLFIHSTYGVGTEFSQTGENGPSIFPYSGLGVRVKVQPVESWYVQAAVVDGVPGDPSHLHGTHVELNSDDGALLVAEGGYAADGKKAAIGAWRYTEKFDDVRDTDGSGNPIRRNNEGMYFVGEYPLIQQGDSGKGLSGFVRAGFANGQVNTFDYAWSAGVVYTGLIPTRDEGQLGLGIGSAHTSEHTSDAALTAGSPVDDAETAVELTYSDAVTPWLILQPDLQYIINPGTDPALDDAWVVGLRTSINF